MRQMRATDDPRQAFDVLERLNTSGVSRNVLPARLAALVFARAMCSALGSVRTNSTDEIGSDDLP